MLLAGDMVLRVKRLGGKEMRSYVEEESVKGERGELSMLVQHPTVITQHLIAGWLIGHVSSNQMLAFDWVRRKDRSCLIGCC